MPQLLQRLESRWRLLPWIALDRRLVRKIKKGVHVCRVELLGVLELKIGWNVRKVVLDAVAPRREIYFVEIADALVLDQCLDGAARDVKNTAFD